MVVHCVVNTEKKCLAQKVVSSCYSQRTQVADSSLTTLVVLQQSAVLTLDPV